MNRRYFLPTLAAAARVSWSAADRVTVGVVGIRGRGRALAAQFAALPDANVAYLCDADQSTFERAAKAVEERGAPRPQMVGDLRRMLEDKSVDAIVIATPDHWHTPAALLACAAGKDVYVEKPASHNVREGRLLMEAAKRYKRVIQHGTQARSMPSIQRAIEFVRSGKVGTVLMAKVWNVQKRANIGHKSDQPVPPGVDYESWTGPALMLPFNLNRFHYGWHWHWNYGTGDIGNDGIHEIDIARWALDVGAPKEVSGMGRKVFFDDDQQTPDTMNITYDYGAKLMQFEMRIWNPYGMQGQDNGVDVYGSEGRVQIGPFHDRKWGFKVFDGKDKLVFYDDANEPETHARNFLEAVRGRKAGPADAEIAHLSCIHSHLGNIVARVRRNIRFDPATETIQNDAQASALLRRQYRRHWGTPSPV